MKKFILFYGLIASGLAYGHDFIDEASPIYMNADRKAAANAVLEISDSNFADKISSGIVIVDFYADWCGPCQRLGPIYVKVAEEMKNSLTFYKINIDRSHLAVEAKNIQYLPTLVIFKDGKEVARRVGGCNETQLKDFISTNL